MRNVGDLVVSPTEEYKVEQPSSSSGVRPVEPKARARRQWTEQEIEAEADDLMDQLLGPPLPLPETWFRNLEGKGKAGPKGKGKGKDRAGRSQAAFTFRTAVAKGKGKGKARRSQIVPTFDEYKRKWAAATDAFSRDRNSDGSDSDLSERRSPTSTWR